MSITLTRHPEHARAAEILSDDALAFIEELHHRFAGRRDELVAAREDRRAEASASGTLNFLPETQAVREGDWKVAPAPAALQDRRVEITGPATPAKMAINALNSGAKVWLADLEDASTPSWENVVDAVANLSDAARGTLAFTSPEGKEYRLKPADELAVVVVRPRGWHLPEEHVLVDGKEGVGALVDFGLHFFHNAKVLTESGQGPFYYLPKMEHHLEVRLWNEVFTFAQEYVGIPHGTIRATMLIETIPAAFQMEEFLYELRDHASGLNAGRWDYLFSIVKTFRDSTAGDFVLPDRGAVSMTSPFMRAYTELLVKTCHRRGAFAMGGMAAVIPDRKDPVAAEAAFAKVRDDKTREANDGFDGSWVAHPDLVPVCRGIFDGVLGEKPNQVDRLREEVQVTPAQLLDVAGASGEVTEAGLRTNLYVAVAYTAVWLSGNGAVAIHNLMEDAATAEISRTQIWQQVNQGVVAADTGNVITAELVQAVLAEEVERLRGEVADEERFERFYVPAAALISRLVSGRPEDYDNFLTLPAYRLLDQLTTQAGAR
ncbi:MAG: malate synthase A [Arthrobacter sp.]|jgi:malate synthase|nr:malate synthase A [Arthrobacter sp.]